MAGSVHQDERAGDELHARVRRARAVLAHARRDGAVDRRVRARAHRRRDADRAASRSRATTSCSSRSRRPTPTAGRRRARSASTVTDEVEAVFAKALAVKPSDRWQTAGEFWNALRQARRDGPDARDDGHDRRTSAADRAARHRARAASRERAHGRRELATRRRPPRTAPSVPQPAHATTTGARRRRARRASSSALGVARRRRHRRRGLLPRRGRRAGERAGARRPRPRRLPRRPRRRRRVGRVGRRRRPPTCPHGMIAIPGGSFFMGSDDGLPFEKPAHQVTLAALLHRRVRGHRRPLQGVQRRRAAASAPARPTSGTTITDKERKAFDPLCNIRDPDGRGEAPDQLRRLGDGREVLPRAGRPPADRGRVGVRGARPRRAQVPVGRRRPGVRRTSTRAARSASPGARSTASKRRRCTTRTTASPNTAPVGSFPKGASRYGVQDVVGNVWEWVADWYGDYGKDEQTDPKGPEPATSASSAAARGTASYASWVRPTFRYKDAPDQAQLRHRLPLREVRWSGSATVEAWGGRRSRSGPWRSACSWPVPSAPPRTSLLTQPLPTPGPRRRSSSSRPTPAPAPLPVVSASSPSIAPPPLPRIVDLVRCAASM